MSHPRAEVTLPILAFWNYVLLHIAVRLLASCLLINRKCPRPHDADFQRLRDMHEV